MKFCRFCRRSFWKWRPFARDFFFRIFYQQSLIYMQSFVEIPLAVSDISEVEDFDIRSRFPWQRRPFWKFQDWMHLLRCGSTFLWSLVKIGSLISENLVGQAHSEKKKKKKRNNNNNNNNKKRCKNNKFPNFVWELNKKRSKNNKSPKLLFGRLN